MKKCSQCKIEKEIKEFWADPRGKVRSYCRTCGSKYNKRKRPKEQTKKYQADRRLKYQTDSEYREAVLVKRRAYVLVHREDILLSNAKIRARRQKLAFDLVLTDIIIPEYCPLTGLKLNLGTGRKKGWDSPSLDRIDRRKGYIKGNIAVVSDLGNTMKNCATFEILREFAKNIPKYIGDDIVQA